MSCECREAICSQMGSLWVVEETQGAVRILSVRRWAVKGFPDKRPRLCRNKAVSVGRNEVTVVVVRDDKKGTEMGNVVDFGLVPTGKV